MSGSKVPGNPDIDASSFASILAGVKRMREQYEPEAAPAPEATKESTQTIDSRREPLIETGEPTRILESPVEGSSRDNVSIPRSRTETPPTGTRNDIRSREGLLNSDKNRIIKQTDANTRNNNSRPTQHVQSYSSIQVSNSQKGNPLLSSSLMKSFPWSYNGQILSDYYINPLIQILFLSLKYHKLHPEYIWTRLKKLNRGSTIIGTTNDDRVLRILLVVVDVDSHQEILRKLQDICIKHDLSLVLAWSFEEAGNYVAYCKKFELSTSKVDSVIKGVKKTDYQSCLVDTFTSVRAVNKTDVINLVANCGSVKNVVLESSKDGNKLSHIQGLGSRKLVNLKNIFTQQFIVNKDYKDYTSV